MPVFDMDAVPDEETAPWNQIVPDGWYAMRLKECKLEEAKKSGLPMWHVRFISIEHDVLAFSIDDYFPLQGKALGKLKGFLKAAGAQHTGKVEIEPFQIIGSEVAVRVAREDYKGKPSMKPDGFGAYKDLSLLGDLRAGIETPSAGSKEQKQSSTIRIVDNDLGDVPF